MSDSRSDAVSGSRGPRPYVLHEANYLQLRNDPPRVAVLPWGATEAHNYHLPHGTDIIEAREVAEQAAGIAAEAAARPIVLPAIPFGNNAQQLDQVATIHMSPATAAALLADVTDSLARQGIERLVILNAHGGNDFKAMVREQLKDRRVFIAVVNFYELEQAVRREVFEQPGDHADEMETSLMLHLVPELVAMEQAGSGFRRPFEIAGFDQPGVWTPRPWSAVHPDTGSGDPSRASAEKGRRYFDAVCRAFARVLIGLDEAEPGQLPLV